jgi:hypothetical protein
MVRALLTVLGCFQVQVPGELDDLAVDRDHPRGRVDLPGVRAASSPHRSPL